MAFAPIALTTPQYEDFPNQFLKAFIQGTTTPLAMATDATGGTTLAKAELDATGFPITAGSARFIPFIDGDYDLWLFPTAAEADANDTTNAIQFADDLNTDPLSNLNNNRTVAQDDSRYGPIFATVAAMVAANPVSIDGIVVDLVTGMSVSVQDLQSNYIVVAPTTSDDKGDQTAANGNVCQLQAVAGRYILTHFGTDGATPTEIAAILQAANNPTRYPHIHAPAATYLFDPDGLTVPSGWSFPPVMLLNNLAFKFTGEGDSTIFKMLSTSTTNAVTFMAFEDLTVDGIEVGPFLILGTGNPGSNGSLLDGTANLGSTNIKINNVNTDRTKRHGHYLTKGATGNTYFIEKVTRCNRNNLGVGIQLEGADNNVFFVDELKDIVTNTTQIARKTKLFRLLCISKNFDNVFQDYDFVERVNSLSRLFKLDLIEEGEKGYSMSWID